ncbi:MAG: hypothetical protein ACLU38_01740 [Dysosmobacter sp.]
MVAVEKPRAIGPIAGDGLPASSLALPEYVLQRTSGIAELAMLTYMEQKQAVFRKHKKLTLAAAAVLSWIGSLAGFGDLISVIFPVFGYLSVVFLVCMMVHFIQCKRREKQSA